MILALYLLTSIHTVSAVLEPQTGVAFDQHYPLEGGALVLTGVDRRRALGNDAYAVAHYVSAEVAAAAGQLPVAERADTFIETTRPKLLVFHGVYPKVPARGIRWSWKQHFRALGLQEHKEFIAAFQHPFRAGERLHFISTKPGQLVVRHDERLIGQWDDPPLVRAIWSMCMGPASENVEPENLVRLSPASIEARRQTESNSPGVQSAAPAAPTTKPIR